LSKRNDLVLAIVDLQEREGTSQDNIGFCEIAAGRLAHNAVSRHPKSCERIGAWAQAKGFEAVIWTALGRRFEEVLSIPFSPAAALSYLDGLSTPTREKALQYIHHAPPQTMTAFRRLLLPEQTKKKTRQ
jgi:hypothetical protein